jgi:copper chaperone CopZ
MTCGGCENAVTRTLGQLKGVEHVTASHAKNEVDVTYDDALVTPAAVKIKIETLGYQVHAEGRISAATAARSASVRPANSSRARTS